MDLSIIIVSWNTRDLLAQCLDSVVSSQIPVDRQDSNLTTDDRAASLRDCLLSTEIFVVDNASSDGSAAMVRQRFPQVRLIENRENVGFARANNQAISRCLGRYVLLLNSDTIVHQESLARMVRFMDSTPNAGIVGALLLRPTGTPQRCFGRFPTILSEAVFAFGLNTYWPFSAWLELGHNLATESRVTDWVLGAAMMVRHKVLEQVGLLDEDYYIFSEEIDLAYRVKRAGWDNHVLATAHITHLGGQSAKQVLGSMIAELFKSKVKYFRKHHGRMSAFFLDLIFIVSMLSRRILYIIKPDATKSSLWSSVWRDYIGSA